MQTNTLGRFVLQSAIAFAIAQPAVAALDGYWPLNETTGTLAPNLAGASPDALLFNGANWVADPTRGQVLQFDGMDGYADAGATTIPQMTLSNNFTWSFWSYDEENIVDGSTNTILGNRYNSDGGEFTPREFVKFTTQAFEFHRNAAGENLDYVNQPSGTWVHNVVVKQGNTLTYYRNGSVTDSRVITAGLNNPMPLYFGGNKQLENWKGKLDDVAIWSDALPAASVAKLSRGTSTPLTASTSQAAMSTILSDNFGAGLNGNLWTVTERGLENTGSVGFTPPSTDGGKLTLGGKTSAQYWFGSTIETNIGFDSSKETLISVDRLSLTVSGTAGRSSLWILGNDGQYLHFSQNLNESGWSWNARNDVGEGTSQPIGTGNNIVSLNPLDTNTGSFKMSIRVVPTGVDGEVFTYMYVDDTLVAGQFFTNFPDEFRVALSAQARATDDTAIAVFDNFRVDQVPEPSAFAFLGLAAAGLGCKRLRRRIGSC